MVDESNNDKEFTNQKQLRVAAEPNQSWSHLSGDESTDDRIDENDSEDNLPFRDSLPLGWPFMHPMHDATADEQLDASLLSEEEQRAQKKSAKDAADGFGAVGNGPDAQ